MEYLYKKVKKNGNIWEWCWNRYDRISLAGNNPGGAGADIFWKKPI
jgi:hypothetical protein